MSSVRSGVYSAQHPEQLLPGIDNYRSVNALAEAFHSLFKAELVRNRGPWKNLDHLEIAVAEYVDWFNHRRLHGEIGLVPLAEFEKRPPSTVA